MQQISIPPNPAQLYQQALPAFSSPLGVQSLQTPQGTDAYQSAANATPPTASNAAVTSPSSTIPDANVVQTQLANSKAVPIGLKYGLIFGALGALPIWGIERYYQKQKGKECPNLIQQLVLLGENSIRPTNMKWSKTLAKKMEKPLLSFMTSAAGTVTVGAITGVTLGWWNVKHIKEKLTDMNKMKQEQQSGTFQPKPLTLMQRLGIAKKPSNNPDQDYQDLLQNNLNQAHAFKQGAYDIAVLKLAPGLAFLGVAGAGLLLTRHFNRAGYDEIMKNADIKNGIKSALHPVMIAKMAALPVIGGLIAKEIVPWAKGQLGIDGNGNATSQPNPASVPAA